MKNNLGFRMSQTVIIVFIIDGDKVLLGTKKTRKYPWRGYGGNLTNDSNGNMKMSIRESAPDYLPGISFDPKNLKLMGILDSFKPDNDSHIPDWATYFYKLEKEHCIGTIQPTTEMNNPTWWDIDNLPYDQMVPCYKDFLRDMLIGKNTCELEIRYDEHHQYKYTRQ